MDVSLKPQVQKFVEDQVKSGHFRSADDVLEEALVRMMEDSAQLDDDTLAAIDRSEDQIARGEYRDWTQVSRELRARYLKQ